jgi:hypothetical protein
MGFPVGRSRTRPDLPQGAVRSFAGPRLRGGGHLQDHGTLCHFAFAIIAQQRTTSALRSFSRQGSAPQILAERFDIFHAKPL